MQCRVVWWQCRSDTAITSTYDCCLQDSKSDERFHVELHFSPGVYSVGQNKEYLGGRGYRPQHGEKKQVPDCHTQIAQQVKQHVGLHSSATVTATVAVSYTHLTLPTIYSV